jgi:UDP-glucose 4-epimerase
MPMKTRAIVNGGADFIGCRVVDRLLADGYRVRVFDDCFTRKRENLPESGDLEILTGDAGRFDDVKKPMGVVELVVHEAATAYVPKTIREPLGSRQANYVGTLNVLDGAWRQGARRVVFVSSAVVHGDLQELPKREDVPLMPLSPYAVDTLASEYAGRTYTPLHGFETVRQRYCHVYGPRQNPSSPVKQGIFRFLWQSS